MSLRVKFSPSSLTFVAIDKENLRSGEIVIPGAPSDATVTFGFPDASPPALFAVIRVRVFEPVRLPNSNQIAELDLVSQSDGSGSVDVSKGQFVFVRIAYVGPILHGGLSEHDDRDLFATFTIKGSGLSPKESWITVRVPLTVLTSQVITALEDKSNTFEIVQGKGNELRILATALVSQTNVEYTLTSPTPEIKMPTRTIEVPTGQVKHDSLHFDATSAAAVGQHTALLVARDIKENATDFLTLPINVLAPSN